MVVQPFSTAEQMAPLLTLLQEQICASAGSAAEARRASRRRGAAESGLRDARAAGRLLSIICSQVP